MVEQIAPRGEGLAPGLGAAAEELGHEPRERERGDGEPLLAHEGIEIRVEIARGRVAPRPVPLEAAEHDPLERLGVIGHDLARPRHRALEDRPHRLVLGGPGLVEPRPRRQLVEHHPERVDVAAAIERLAEALLR